MFYAFPYYTLAPFIPKGKLSLRALDGIKIIGDLNISIYLNVSYPILHVFNVVSAVIDTDKILFPNETYYKGDFFFSGYVFSYSYDANIEQFYINDISNSLDNIKYVLGLVKKRVNNNLWRELL